MGLNAQTAIQRASRGVRVTQNVRSTPEIEPCG